MEQQKKLLLVILLVGCFLLVVTAVGLYFYAPRNTDTALAKAPLPPSNLSGSPTAAGVYDAPTVTVSPNKDSDLDVEADNGSEPLTSHPAPAADEAGPTVLDVTDWIRNPSTIGELSAQATATSSRGDIIIFYGERPESLTKPAETVSRSTSDPSPVISQTPPTSAPAASPAKPSSQPVAVTPVKSPAAAPASTTAVLIDQFWIQTHAFSLRSRAEAVKSILAQKGITALIETRDHADGIIFRVRIGPYLSRAEADYWLGLVKDIDGFAESYISLVKLKP